MQARWRPRARAEAARGGRRSCPSRRAPSAAGSGGGGWVGRQRVQRGKGGFVWSRSGHGCGCAAWRMVKVNALAAPSSRAHTTAGFPALQLPVPNPGPAPCPHHCSMG
eukprot:scaffold4359_cov106-Isochrysis_galbana.AAC.4